MSLNIIKDWKNYNYAKECFRILVDDPGIKEYYKLKYKGGVMFTAVFVDSDLPNEFVDQAILNKLAILDEAMMMMNMAGIFKVVVQFIPTQPDKKRTYYKILFKPRLDISTKIITFLIIPAAIITAGILLNWFKF